MQHTHRLNLTREQYNFLVGFMSSPMWLSAHPHFQQLLEQFEVLDSDESTLTDKIGEVHYELTEKIREVEYWVEDLKKTFDEMTTTREELEKNVENATEEIADRLDETFEAVVKAEVHKVLLSFLAQSAQAAQS